MRRFTEKAGKANHTRESQFVTTNQKQTPMNMKKQSQFRRPAFGFFAAALLCLTVHSAMAATIWDANADFSLASNPNGAWSYQWLTGLAPGQYGIMTSSTTTYGNNPGLLGWSQPGGLPVVVKNTSPTTTYFSWAPGVLGMHPDNGGNHAVVTWTAPSAGAYSFVSSFTLVGTGGDGVIASVTRNLSTSPSEQGQQYLAAVGNSWSWNNASMTLNAGETISWALNPNETIGADSTVLTAVVTAVPEPSTFALVAGALVCGAVLVRSRRQRTSH